MLTLDGAAAAGLDSEIGSLDRGKWADVCVIELSDTPRRASEVMAGDLLDTEASPVAATIVGGRVVYRAGTGE
jgi:cytosine/adenosine deaminase-related metal-dependent hydrolase